jgi:vacuolar-type H+-ATPase subunit H
VAEAQAEAKRVADNARALAEREVSAARAEAERLTAESKRQAQERLSQAVHAAREAAEQQLKEAEVTAMQWVEAAEAEAERVAQSHITFANSQASAAPYQAPVGTPTPEFKLTPAPPGDMPAAAPEGVNDGPEASAPSAKKSVIRRS